MFLIGKINETLFPGEHHRMFDWKLDANTLSVRLSLTALEWSSIKIKGRVFYGTQFADVFPDNGYITLEVDSANISGLEIASTKHTVFTYPEEFDSVLLKNHIPLVLDAAYELEHELTGIIPIGGDPLRFTFHPLYDGAAIEGDPIYIGPGMWGKFPLWFVYFHEMGHNYCNASERFGQLYPLMLSVPPGPLPTNILYYEGFASLPAMYVYEQIEKNPTILDIDPTITKEIIEDWQNVKRRFISAWNKYKDNPISTSLNPDIVDGLILELVEEYGWDIFREFYWLLRPVDKPLPLFNKHLPGDTPDLAKTRSTFTVALFSAAANVDLSKRFKEWGFPIDDELFDSAFSELIVQMKIPHDIHN